MDDESGNTWEALLSGTPLAKHLEDLGAERERERIHEEIKRAQEEVHRIREEMLKELRQTVLAIVSGRLPGLLTLAQEKVECLTDTAALNILVVQVATVQTEEDARQYLLSLE